MESSSHISSYASRKRFASALPHTLQQDINPAPVADQGFSVEALSSRPAVGFAKRTRAYPEAPALIQRAWNALVPAVIELSHHMGVDRMTLVQSVRKVKNLRGTGTRAVAPDTFVESGDILDGWLYDVLVPIGTLPIENVEASERFAIAGAERLLTSSFDQYDAGISAQSRNEAMVCLEMLCTKAWYERNREGRTTEETSRSILGAMQFLYWECGIPMSLTLIWDDPLELWHPAYEQVRQFNYRQLYAVEQAGLVNELLTRISRGVIALAERRQRFRARFKRLLKNDVRWERSFSEHSEAIKAKYTTQPEA